MDSKDASAKVSADIKGSTASASAAMRTTEHYPIHRSHHENKEMFKITPDRSHQKYEGYDTVPSREVPINEMNSIKLSPGA